jgi:hypothetical protein
VSGFGFGGAPLTAYTKVGGVLTPAQVRTKGQVDTGRASPFTDPDTSLNQQPVGQSGFGDPIVSEEFGGEMTVVDAGAGLVRFRADGPAWATWYPDWPRFNIQNPGGNHTNTDEDCYYITSKASVTGGALVLACDRQQTVAGLPYTAGMIQSIPFYTPKYGYFESRIKLAAVVNGTWPAFWASCSTYDQWPPEIDFWEQFGPATTYESHVYLPGSAYHDVGNVADVTSYQVYGCLWTPTEVSFYLNGVQTGTTTAVPDQPLYVIAKNGARAPATPAYDSCDLSIDYIRCWALP